MDKRITLDGPEEMQISKLKEFLGLRPEQSFQDIEIDDEDENETENKQ